MELVSRKALLLCYSNKTNPRIVQKISTHSNCLIFMSIHCDWISNACAVNVWKIVLVTARLCASPGCFPFYGVVELSLPDLHNASGG